MLHQVNKQHVKARDAMIPPSQVVTKDGLKAETEHFTMELAQ